MKNTFTAPAFHLVAFLQHFVCTSLIFHWISVTAQLLWRLARFNAFRCWRYVTQLIIRKLDTQHTHFCVSCSGGPRCWGARGKDTPPPLPPCRLHISSPKTTTTRWGEDAVTHVLAVLTRNVFIRLWIWGFVLAKPWKTLVEGVGALIYVFILRKPLFLNLYIQ